VIVTHRFRACIGTTIVVGLLVSACSAEAVSETTSSTIPRTAELSEIDIQGHRGARGLKPENTLPAFEAALDLGVTTLEFDLHFTADDDVVIWHDPVITPDKCGLRSGAPDSVPDPDDPETSPDELAVRALTVSDLHWYDCVRNPDSDRFPDQDPSATELAGSDFRLVTLEELIEFIETYEASATKTDAQRSGARMIRFNIETKREPGVPSSTGDGFDGVNAGPFELRILEIIAEHGLHDRVVIQSFEPRSLRAIHAVEPDIGLAILTAFFDVPFEEITALGISIWSPSSETATDPLVTKAHSVGLAVVPWTVNDVDEMEALIGRGVDGFITDRPDLAVGR
jgi:glycerophosphoryl diester phosphodiesterase